MKRFIPAICLILFIAFFSVSCGNGDSGDPAWYSASLQQMLEAKWDRYGAGKPNWGGGIALCIFSPRGGYFSSTGFTEDVTEGLHFRGASTTKTFTAAAILLLHQEGRLNIDDKITDLIPNGSQPYLPADAQYNIPYKSQITIRQLLGHRAGVFDVSNDPIPGTAGAPYAGKYYITYVKEDLGQPYHQFTFDELVGVVAENQLYDSQPGTEFHYTNTGYSILGKIIERVSGLSYWEFIQNRFLDPLNMDQTSFPYLGHDTSLPVPYAPGYLWYQETLYDVTEDNMSPHVAEGNVITTYYDLTNWVKLLFGGETGLSPNSLAMMMDVEPTYEQHQYYGLGCQYTPGLGYGHNGGHIGYMTVMRYDPEHDLAIVISSSVLQAENLQEQLALLYDIGFSAREILGYPGH